MIFIDELHAAVISGYKHPSVQVLLDIEPLIELWKENPKQENYRYSLRQYERNGIAATCHEKRFRENKINNQLPHA